MINSKYTSAIALLAATLLALPSCKKDSNDAQALSSDTIAVRVMTASGSAGESLNQYSGVIEEKSGSVLSFSLPGTIKQILVKEGQRVAKGQLIATLEANSVNDNLEIARAALATAQDTYNRMKQLHAAGAITDMKWVEVENTLNSARSAYNIAKNAVGDASIHSPIAGVVSEKYVEAGSTVAPTVPVVKIIETSPVKATISVSESQIGKIPSSAKATITVEALGGATYTGTLTDKAIAADPLSRTYSVSFLIDNKDGRLLPGMLCNVTVDAPVNAASATAADDATGYVVPVDAVQLDFDNSHYLWVVRDSKAQLQKVTLGDYTDTGVRIASGLNRGDSVIVRGQQKVSPGIQVKIEK